MTGEDFAKLKIVNNIEESAASAASIKGQTPGTRRFHISELCGLQTLMRRFPALQQLPLDRVLQCYIRWIAANPKKGGWWLPQTLHRRVLNLLGALAALPLYSNANSGISVKTNAEISATLARLTLLSTESQPVHQRAATAEDIAKAIAMESNIVIQVAIILQWYLGARVGDILSLLLKNIKQDQCHLDVTITDGKGTKIRGTHYSIHTVTSKEHAEILLKHSKTLTANQLIVTPSVTLSAKARVAAINTALKRARPGLTTRTIRRGALQAMAVGTAELPPVPLETLMSFAGHLRPETTKRYLDWGRLFGAAAVEERKAAAALQVRA
jgi:integrase